MNSRSEKREESTFFLIKKAIVVTERRVCVLSLWSSSRYRRYWLGFDLGFDLLATAGYVTNTGQNQVKLKVKTTLSRF
jgi:hypothetical protein